MRTTLALALLALAAPAYAQQTSPAPKQNEAQPLRRAPSEQAANKAAATPTRSNAQRPATRPENQGKKKAKPAAPTN